MLKPDWQTPDSRVQLFLGDCLQILPELGKVDAVVTDPPYGIDVGSMQLGKGRKATSFERFSWDVKPSDDAMAKVVTSGENAIVWGGNYFVLPPSGCWLSWDKVQEFSGADFELAWTTLKTPSRCFRLSRVEAYGAVPREHPTQKPLPLMLWCLGFLPNAETILDSFMGSGTTGVACLRLNRRFIGIEKEPKYFEIAVKRIQRELEQPTLAFPEVETYQPVTLFDS